MLPVSAKFQTGSAKSNFWATIVFGLALVKVLEAFLANTISTNIIWAGFAGFEHILYCFSFGAAAHHYPRYFLSFFTRKFAYECRDKLWSWRQESNLWPTQYECVALPTELHQHIKYIGRQIIGRCKAGLSVSLNRGRRRIIRNYSSWHRALQAYHDNASFFACSFL